jgi:hypothetical protein
MIRCFDGFEFGVAAWIENGDSHINAGDPGCVSQPELKPVIIQPVIEGLDCVECDRDLFLKLGVQLHGVAQGAAFS